MTTFLRRTTTKSGHCYGADDAWSSGTAWPKHRIVFLLAGTFTLRGIALAAGVNPWFALLPGLVGVNQLLLVATGWCPASALLDRVVLTDKVRQASPFVAPDRP